MFSLLPSLLVVGLVLSMMGHLLTCSQNESGKQKEWQIFQVVSQPNRLLEGKGYLWFTNQGQQMKPEKMSVH